MLSSVASVLLSNAPSIDPIAGDKTRRELCSALVCVACSWAEKILCETRALNANLATDDGIDGAPIAECSCESSADYRSTRSFYCFISQTWSTRSLGMNLVQVAARGSDRASRGFASEDIDAWDVVLRFHFLNHPRSYALIPSAGFALDTPGECLSSICVQLGYSNP
ncbi:hypothetical protein EDD85DRAFT_959170 [Armillaria nabsnona]|nr:hypothetical protein EDD85DRAFT_959170 [Armillaria nabsnona]